jgi:hypothetical protein
MADGTVKARPVRVLVDRMLSTVPGRPLAIQRLPSASVQYIAPCSVVARMASAARGDRVSVRAMKVAAALFTSTSIGATAHCASTIASTAAASRTSHTAVSTWAPVLRQVAQAWRRWPPAPRRGGRTAAGARPVRQSARPSPPPGRCHRR